MVIIIGKEKQIGARIKARREQLKMTQEELGTKLSLNKSSIQRYEAGIVSKIKLPILQAMAQAMDVDPNWLALKTDQMGHFSEIPQENFPLPKNLVPLKKVRYIPLIGRIACGVPILAEENIIDRIILPDSVNADYALTCQGDSMIDAGIDNEDIVFIRQQPEVENGEIAAVLIGEEATLKKVYFNGEKLSLIPANSACEPFIYVGNEINQVRILGKAVAVLKNIE